MLNFIRPLYRLVRPSIRLSWNLAGTCRGTREEMVYVYEERLLQQPTGTYNQQQLSRVFSKNLIGPKYSLIHKSLFLVGSRFMFSAFFRQSPDSESML